MSITDELRVFAKRWPYTDYIHKDMLAIADRIDAEHERAMADAYLSGMPTDEKLTELGWIRLPKDADDVPWHPGDCDEDGNVVITLKLASSGWYVITDGDWPYRPESKRHYHTLTVEDVLREFANGWDWKSGHLHKKLRREAATEGRRGRMSYASDALIDAQEREIKRLKDENAKLREELDDQAGYDQMLRDILCQQTELCIKAEADNAKLRELSSIMLKCIMANERKKLICWECPMHKQFDELRSYCCLEHEAKKLGIGENE